MSIKWLVYGFVGVLGALASRAQAAPDTKAAGALFAEAEAICQRDKASMWGTSLCGPILIVDYTDRRVITNAPDAEKQLEKQGRWYVGTLPESVIIANTPTEWAGVRWTQLVSIFPEAPSERRVMVAHELFHRIQTSLGLSRAEQDNGHLDSLEGRYLLQLEWRALARALTQKPGPARVAAVADALGFRAERHRLFPHAAASEAALDTNEGIPEYTGVRLALNTRTKRVAYALHDLEAYLDAPTFVRSFAYAHGPAYGLLLDEVSPGWHRSAATAPGFEVLLRAKLDLTPYASDELATRTRRYDDGTLRASEQARDDARKALLADYRARLVDGPVLVLPMDKANLQFKPLTLVPLVGIGTVYPTLQLQDAWGTLVVEQGGALVHKSPRHATVPAVALSQTELTGKGWRLTLNPGWRLRAGKRPGDFTVECVSCAGK